MSFLFFFFLFFRLAGIVWIGADFVIGVLMWQLLEYCSFGRVRVCVSIRVFLYLLGSNLWALLSLVRVHKMQHSQPIY
jgi:hypothetical protein